MGKAEKSEGLWGALIDRYGRKPSQSVLIAVLKNHSEQTRLQEIACRLHRSEARRALGRARDARGRRVENVRRRSWPVCN